MDILDNLKNIIFGIIIGAFVMWIIMINIKKEPVILNEDELNRRADEMVKDRMDTIRTWGVDSIIKWSMSDHR